MSSVAAKIHAIEDLTLVPVKVIARQHNGEWSYYLDTDAEVLSDHFLSSQHIVANSPDDAVLAWWNEHAHTRQTLYVRGMRKVWGGDVMNCWITL